MGVKFLYLKRKRFPRLNTVINFEFSDSGVIVDFIKTRKTLRFRKIITFSICIFTSGQDFNLSLKGNSLKFSLLKIKFKIFLSRAFKYFISIFVLIKSAKPR